jgi:phosphoglycerate dehydrogenase-like enzyme
MHPMHRGLAEERMRRRQAIVIIESQSLDMVFGPREIEAISRHVHFVAPPQTRESIAVNPSVLRDVELVFGGWGMPALDDELLAAAPKLSTIFYAAGAVGSWMTEAAWDRGIIVTTASEANSIPVAEFTLATVLFSLKHGWSLTRRTRAERTYPDRNGAPGAFESTVGLVSLGSIGARVASMLRAFDLNLIAHDPYVTGEHASALGVELVPLMELFERSDVVSLHTPELPETVGMIAGRHIAEMKEGATLINTSRGPLIREEEMLDVLQRRPDLHAVLDTVCIEPPPLHSRLYSLDNVTLTPHIAGSVGGECRRMAQFMVEELERYVSGQPLKWALTRESVANSVHRPLSCGKPAITVEIAKKLIRKGIVPDSVAS